MKEIFPVKIEMPPQNMIKGRKLFSSRVNTGVMMTNVMTRTGNTAIDMAIEATKRTDTARIVMGRIDMMATKMMMMANMKCPSAKTTFR